MFDIEHTSILYEIIGFSNIGSSDLTVADHPSEASRLWVQPEHYKVVGVCLAAARRHANLTQQDLARRLGKPQSFVSEYERGLRRIDVIEFLLIARTLGADPLDLLGEIARSAAE
jgi:predicted transcriptional regulator